MPPELTILHGDWIEQLRTLRDGSIQCCVTSPPYWGLRDYGVAGQLGLESSIGEYLEKMVAGFREVHRVLRHDGTLWLNLGDAYAGGGNGGGGSFAKNGIRNAEQGTDKNVAARKGSRGVGGRQDLIREGPARGGCSSWDNRDMTPRSKGFSGIKAKSLMGIPWRVAFALQDDGWILRTEVIWHKPNPMPESVTDRPTRAHEYIFLFAKSRKYFYDAFAINEPCSASTHARVSQNVMAQAGSTRAHAGRKNNGPMRAMVAGMGIKYKMPGANSRLFVNRDTKHERFVKMNSSFSAATLGLVATRNKRSVWTIGSKAYKGAHFATFPPALVEPCIKAGTSERGACPACRAPWVRVIGRGEPDLAHQIACGGDATGQYTGKATKDFAKAGAQDASATKARILAGMVERKTIGWKPGCVCGLEQTVPCEVLDPFGGSGTTGEVALKLDRAATLIEINPEYITLAQKRCRLT